MSETHNNAKSLIKSLSYISDIYRYCENVNLNSFLNDSMLADACLMKLIVLGEYVTRVSDDFKKQHSDIPWQQIKDLRNIVAHNYDGVNYRLIWDVIQEDIPDLEKLYVDLLMNEFNMSLNDFESNGLNFAYLPYCKNLSTK